MDDAPQTTDCNNGLGHQEEEKDSKWDTSLCFLDSEITLLDSMEKHNDILFETLVRNDVLNFEILDEEVDVSFEIFHEHSLHGSFEYQFDKVLEELQLEKLCHDRYIT